MVSHDASHMIRFAKKGHAGGIKALIAAGANVNQGTTDNGTTPLYIASQNGHKAVVGDLIAAGGNVDLGTTDDGATPLYIAS